jgi:hypothetical protein
VPVITITGLQLGSIIAFAIITETVFQWPGVGLLFINAVQFVDIPVMAAYLMLIAVMFVVINLIVDLLYYVVDPRLRVDAQRGGMSRYPDGTTVQVPATPKPLRPWLGTATCGLQRSGIRRWRWSRGVSRCW